MRFFLCIFPLLCLTACEPQGSQMLRSDEPVNRAVASYEADFTFPENAFDVYYFVYSDGVKLREFYRFDLEIPQDILGNPEKPPHDYIRYLLEEHSQVRQGAVEYKKHLITGNPETDPEFPQPEARFLPMPWWNPEEIKQGYALGESKAGELYFLIDEQNSRVYYHYFNE